MPFYKTFSISCTLMLICTCIFAQNRNYTKEWKTIDSLLDKAGLPQSALAVINNIYTSAKKENNQPQVIKALIYRMSVSNQVSDESSHENIRLIESEISTAKEPASSILRSIAGGMYWQYLQQNRWKFYDRTRTISNKGEDIATWDLSDLHSKITSHYLNSLTNAKVLQNTKLETYEAIIEKGNVRQLRPTLFDLLAHRALEYLQNDERYVSKPAYTFEINDIIAFADAEQFANHRFTTTDTSSLHFRALQVYQNLLKFHVNDRDKSALLDADINRYEFVKNFSTHPNKDSLYKNALENLVSKFPREKGIADAMYLLAQFHAYRGINYNPIIDTTNRYELAKAKEWCERAIAQGSGSQNSNALNLLQEITSRSISIDAEKVNVPGEAFRVLISYKNAEKATLKIVRADAVLRESFVRNQWQDSTWTKLLSLRHVQQLEYSLPSTKDFQMHRVEAKINALPVGEYALLVSDEKTFGLKQGSLSVVFFYVSNLAYVRSQQKYYIVNRTSGEPLSGAVAEVWNMGYDYQKQKNVLQHFAKLTTDKNGYFELNASPSANQQRNLRIDIRYKADRLFLDEQSNFVYDYEPPKQKNQTYLFTDRSIYRPGQTVMFKGIQVYRDKKYAHSVVAGRKSLVELFDANDKRIDSVALTSSEFGSYSGTFTLPAGGLAGVFRIRDASTQSETIIRVEEYKRPKFYVTIAPPKGTFRVNDTITVEASSLSYAGSNVDGASVSYRVVRRVQMPMWRYSLDHRMIWPPYPAEDVEIAHGTGTTDANGKMKITFAAVPDAKIGEQQQPTFYYDVFTDVTDISGETRSATSSVAVGFQALKVRLSVPDTEYADSLKQIGVHSTNFSDSFQSATASISFYKLAAPSKLFRERFWDRPDQFIMSREDYYRQFPYDQYDNESEVSSWKKEKLVLQQQVTTTRDGNVMLQAKTFEPGWYVVEVSTTDKYNKPVTDKKYVQLIREKINGPIYKSQLVINSRIPNAGQAIRYSISSNIDSAFFINEIVTSSDTSRRTVKGAGSQSYTTSKDTRGSVHIKAFTVKNNRLIFTSELVALKSADTSIKVDYVTFRDKVQPGAKEKWAVKISGTNGEKVSAELLTAMYDASLDQFLKHEWNSGANLMQPIDISPWTGDFNFQTVSSTQKYSVKEQPEGFTKIYDRLKTDEQRGVQYMSREQKAMRRNNKSVPEALHGAVSGVVVQDAVATAPLQKEEAEGSGNNKAASGGEPPLVQPRTNLQETAFFYPNLSTDLNGNVEFSFTTPEALTTWKWMLFAHTKSYNTHTSYKEIIAQKDLMVQPNIPRFLREGDVMNITAKITNTTDALQQGDAELMLTDPETGKNINALFNNKSAVQSFSLQQKSSGVVRFNISVPKGFSKPLVWRITARTSNGKGTLTDGEQAMVPILTNRILVTETMVMSIRGDLKKEFTLEKLSVSEKSETLKHHALTLEFTSNPAWYAVQALPFLEEGEKQNAEQLFNSFYANALASHLTKVIPRIKSIVEKWNSSDSSAFLSTLQKNQALKSILLEETPWVLDAQNEEQQKRNIALLFDVLRMNRNMENSLTKLEQMQMESGGFVWIAGAPEDRYMTQYIVTGIGRLVKLKAIPATVSTRIQSISKKALLYLDKQIKSDYDRLRKQKSKVAGGGIDNLQTHYLYMRSFFSTRVSGDVFPAYNYFKNEARKTWIKQSTYNKGMIALSLARTGDLATAKKIMASLKETSINNEELGMYWKDVTAGYYWYLAPIETQSLMIEAFTEVTNDTTSTDNLKTWLLKNKQARNWKTSKATADACFALLLRGSDWLSKDASVSIKMGARLINPISVQEGTGYFTTTVPADSIQSAMARVSVTPQNKSVAAVPSWGALYWQYFEDLDKITLAKSPLSIRKQLMIQRNTDRGIVLDTLSANNSISVGDKIKVRIVISSDRTLEYVHLKDMRASSFEPVNVLSNYKWQGGLGYYESTKDASVNFYFNVLPKGVYVFEYEMFATQSGTFSNGISTIQCMYAPEFASHSEGIKVNVANR